MAAFLPFGYGIKIVALLLTVFSAFGVSATSEVSTLDTGLPDVLPPDFANRFPQAVANVTDPEATDGLTIAIPLPPSLVDFANGRSGPKNELSSTSARPSLPPTDMADYQREFLMTSLPALLSQFEIPTDEIPALVEGGIPLLMEAFSELTGDNILTRRSTLVKRNIFDRIGGFFKSRACEIVAASVGVPGFLLSADQFAIFNWGGGVRVTDDQNFFIYPVHGDIANDARVRVHYDAKRAVGFNSAGTTFNREVYVVNKDDQSPTPEAMTRLLIHEIQHVAQYRDYLYILPAFGLVYTFQLCRYGYDNMPLENAARAKEKGADSLLYDYRGQWFKRVWSDNSLKVSLGFPVQAQYTTKNVKPCGQAIELRFQHGVLQLRLGDGYRTFSNEEVANLTPALESRPFIPYSFGGWSSPPPCPTSTTTRSRSPGPTRFPGPAPQPCGPGCKRLRARFIAPCVCME